MKFRTSLAVTAAAALLSSFAVVAADTDAAKPDAPAKEAKAAQPCKNTGSRIHRKDVDQCEKISSYPVRRYSAEEIQTTGEMNIADALRKLDPSFR